MRSPRHAHTTAIKITFAVLLTAALAACSSDSDLPPPASATPPPSAETPSLNLTPAEQQAVEEAQALFDDFMTAYVEVTNTNEVQETRAGGVLGGRALEFLTSPLREEVQREIADNFRQEQVTRGSLQWNLMEVVAVDLEREVEGVDIPEVVLLYCIDLSDWETVTADSGEVVDRPTGRNVATTRAVYTDHGSSADVTWRLAEFTIHQDQQC